MQTPSRCLLCAQNGAGRPRDHNVALSGEENPEQIQPHEPSPNTDRGQNYARAIAVVHQNEDRLLLPTKKAVPVGTFVECNYCKLRSISTRGPHIGQVYL